LEQWKLDEVAVLGERAARAEERAVQARRHAEEAREQARLHAAGGDPEAEMVFRQEAEAHERAARVTETTAALYHQRIRHLQG
jgi:hypothetical protein